jgi:hypothetical protein
MKPNFASIHIAKSHNAASQAKTWQRVCLPLRTTKDSDNFNYIKQTNHDRQGSTGGNMGLASCGVTCLNSSSVFQNNFSAGLTVLCPENPHERQAQKR